MGVAGSPDAVTCVGPGFCVAVGGAEIPANGDPLATPEEAGLIIVTKDGGRTWRQAIGATSLSGVACSSAATCYAVGNGGTIMATIDAGTAWTRQDAYSTTSGASLNLVTVSCPSVTSCYAVGEQGVVVAMTAQGGWQTQPNPLDGTPIALVGLSCPGTLTCYAVGTPPSLPNGPGAILVTTDGGLHWRTQAYPQDQSPHPTFAALTELIAVACPNTAVCYAVGNGGVIVTTGDGGQTWHRQSSGTAARLTGITCPTLRACYVVGEVSDARQAGTVIATADGGHTWHQVFHTDTALSGIACPSVARCYAVGDQATIVVSPDAGKTWRRLHTPLNGDAAPQLARIACPSAAICYAVGGWNNALGGEASGAGTILATRDDGHSWSQVASPGQLIAGVVCPGVRDCYAVGFGGTILASADGGATWQHRHARSA